MRVDEYYSLNNSENKEVEDGWITTNVNGNFFF